MIKTLVAVEIGGEIIRIHRFSPQSLFSTAMSNQL